MDRYVSFLWLCHIMDTSDRAVSQQILIVIACLFYCPSLFYQDSELFTLHDEECGIIDRYVHSMQETTHSYVYDLSLSQCWYCPRMMTEWMLPSGQPPKSFHSLENCERQESYFVPKTLWATKVLCNASARVVVDTSVLCIWMVLLS